MLFIINFYVKTCPGFFFLFFSFLVSRKKKVLIICVSIPKVPKTISDQRTIVSEINTCFHCSETSGYCCFCMDNFIKNVAIKLHLSIACWLVHMHCDWVINPVGI